MWKEKIKNNNKKEKKKSSMQRRHDTPLAYLVSSSEGRVGGEEGLDIQPEDISFSKKNKKKDA